MNKGYLLYHFLKFFFSFCDHFNFGSQLVRSMGSGNLGGLEERVKEWSFLDFSKAFDTINHHILLGELYKYGIRGLPHGWFSSYITNRKQYVKVGNTESSLKTITWGVPQGSTLGPLLFLLYINDLPKSSKKLTFRIFADDTNMFYSSKDKEQLQSVINEELGKVLKFCAANMDIRKMLERADRLPSKINSNFRRFFSIFSPKSKELVEYCKNWPVIVTVLKDYQQLQ